MGPHWLKPHKEVAYSWYWGFKFKTCIFNDPYKRFDNTYLA